MDRKTSPCKPFFNIPSILNPSIVPLLLWDAKGNEIRDNFPVAHPYPDLLSEDADLVPFDFEKMAVKVKELSNSKVTSLEPIAKNHYTVIDAVTENDKHFIIRVVRLVATSPDLDVVQDRFRRECELMEWLNSALTSLPIPRLHYYAVDEPYPYMIMEKCDGELLADHFGLFSFEAKVANIRSYARTAVELFKMKAPEGVGSLTSFERGADQHSHTVILGPSVMSSDPPTAMPSITDYFKWLLQTKRGSSKLGETEKELEDAHSALNRLEKLIFDCISSYDPAILKCIPSHEDLGPHNVLTDTSGMITGVIDWEFHMVKPAVLAVSYPSWIRYDGRRDPRFMHPDGAASCIWFSSPGDAAKLRGIYDEASQRPERAL
ncbi:hypothetical protein CVT26_008750 [Gymnopilus dilepis]|uniref:Aminoglycoside phosphotransferase domain-containing protein n=1 Tax=Gymnopilus dilepis TaxID=231916 RepID=A0A409YG54_9AGAR|nr:hypothetical protein CVT26_008750 [Gymnopilus dilepis]